MHDDAPPPAPVHIHLVEDDPDIAQEIRVALETKGYHLDHSATALAALKAIRSDPAIQLIIADRMLPEMDGLTLIQALRDDGLHTPVLILSALGSVDDRVKGLKAGGDDYLTKPFAMAELDARIEALLRRPADSRTTFLRLGSLELDLITREVRRGDRPVTLSPREFKLLEYLVRRPNQVITTAMLLTDVWQYRFIPQTNVVDVHMGKLRHKLEEGGEVPMIHRVRGAGFMIRAED